MDDLNSFWHCHLSKFGVPVNTYSHRKIVNICVVSNPGRVPPVSAARKDTPSGTVTCIFPVLSKCHPALRSWNDSNVLGPRERSLWVLKQAEMVRPFRNTTPTLLTFLHPILIIQHHPLIHLVLICFPFYPHHPIILIILIILIIQNHPLTCHHKSNISLVPSHPTPIGNHPVPIPHPHPPLWLVNTPIDSPHIYMHIYITLGRSFWIALQEEIDKRLPHYGCLILPSLDTPQSTNK